MVRRLLIFLHYLGLTGYFLFGGASLFMALFSLWMELVLLLLVYVVISLLDPVERRTGNAANALIGSGPVLGFQIIMAAWASEVTGEHAMHELSYGSGLLVPLRVYEDAIFCTGVSLLLIYGFMVYQHVKKARPPQDVLSGLFFQAIALSVFGLVGVLLAVVLPSESVFVVPFVLVGIRLLLFPGMRRYFAADA